ncbi:hypothetical protein [Streptomyces sp. CT34]|nr:hypothetical protein [Streptomyces sp. CT34]
MGVLGCVPGEGGANAAVLMGVFDLEPRSKTPVSGLLGPGADEGD